MFSGRHDDSQEIRSLGSTVIDAVYWQGDDDSMRLRQDRAYGIWRTVVVTQLAILLDGSTVALQSQF
jgi:hypothetical protein